MTQATSLTDSDIRRVFRITETGDIAELKISDVANAPCPEREVPTSCLCR